MREKLWRAPILFFLALLMTAAFPGRAEAAEPGTAHVIVENNTYTSEKAPFTGELFNEEVEVTNPWMTVQDVLVMALQKVNKDVEKVEVVGIGNDYITSINGLAEGVDENTGAGWRVLLNGWIATGSLDDGSVTVQAGDEIRIAFTINNGMDIGAVDVGEGVSDTSLADLCIEGGQLSESFEKGKQSYDLTLSEEISEISVRPEAINRNYQVNVYKGKNPDVTKKGYGPYAKIPVKAGNVVTIICGDPSWPTANVGVEYSRTTYTIKIKKGDSSNFVPGLTSENETSVSQAISVPYSIDLAPIFYDEDTEGDDGESLTYQFRKDASEDFDSNTLEGSTYTETFTEAGNHTIEFRAKDKQNAVSPVYTVNLLVYDDAQEYTITPPESVNEGTFTVSKTSAGQGEKIIITAKGKKAKYALTHLKVDDGQVPIYKESASISNGKITYKYSFIMPGKDVSIEGAFTSCVSSIRFIGVGAAYGTSIDIKVFDSNGFECAVSKNVNFVDSYCDTERFSYIVTDKNGRELMRKENITAISYGQSKMHQIYLVRAKFQVGEEDGFVSDYRKGIERIEITSDGLDSPLLPYEKVECRDGGYSVISYIMDIGVKYNYKVYMVDKRITDSDWDENLFVEWNQSDSQNTARDVTLRPNLTPSDMTIKFSKGANAKLFATVEKAYQELTPLEWAGEPQTEGNYDVYKLEVQKGRKYFVIAGGGDTKYCKFVYSFAGEKGNVENVFDLNEKGKATGESYPAKDDLYTSIRKFANISEGTTDDSSADSMYLHLNVGEEAKLEAFRTNQTTLNTMTNQFVEPDMHYKLLSGEGVVTLSDSGKAGRYYQTVKAIGNGTAVIQVTYDEMVRCNDGDGATYHMYYYFNPIKLENAGIIFVTVGDNDPDAIDPGMEIATRTKSDQDGKIALRKDYDTIYLLDKLTLPGDTKQIPDEPEKKANAYTFSPSSTAGEIAKVEYHAPLQAGDGWSDVWEDATHNEDGTYTIYLQPGRNIVRITDSQNNVLYTMVNAKKLNVTVSNETAEKDGRADKTIKIGDKIAVTFDGLQLPVYKMSAIYNPGYPATTWVEYTLNAEHEGGGTELPGEATQYAIHAVNTVYGEVDGITNTLSAGQIHCGHLGSALGTHLIIPAGGMYKNFNATAGTNDQYFGILPDIRFTAGGHEAEFAELVKAATKLSPLLSIKEIRAARAFYEELSAEEKALDSVKESKAALDKAYEKVKGIVDLIDWFESMNGGPSMADAPDIDKMEEAYNKLPAEQQLMVDKFTKLKDYINYVKKVRDLIADIKGLPEVNDVKPEDKDAIQNLLDTYNSLTDDQKEYVLNYDILKELGDRVKGLTAVQEVIDLIRQIDKLTEENYESKEALILKARQLYELLSADQKKLVTNIGELTAAEELLNTFKSDPDIRKLIELIKELRDGTDGKGNGPLNQTGDTWEVWKNWADYVKNVRAMVDRIEKSRQGKITNLADLEAAEKQVQRIRVSYVEGLIRALPSETTVDYSDGGAVVANAVGDADLGVPHPEPAAAARQMTDTELAAIATAKDEYDSLSTEERATLARESASSVTKLEVLDDKAASYDGYVETVMQKFLDRVETCLGADGEVTRLDIAAAAELVARYESFPAERREVLDKLVTAQGTTGAKLLEQLAGQKTTAEAEIAETERIDELISSLPTVVNADNLDAVKAEVEAIEAAIAKLSDDAKGYLYQMNRLEALKKLLDELGVEILDPDTPMDDIPLEEAKPEVTAKSAGYNSVTVTWTEVSGAQSYRIYRQKKGKGSYTKVATVDATVTSWTNKNLVTNRVYRYKVRAVAATEAGNIYSQYGVSAKVQPVPAKASITKVAAGKRYLKVTWKKVSGASGYVVYRASSKNGKYKAVKTVKSGKTVSWKNTKLTGGKTYYYKVRAYRTVSGKKVYGSYSAKVGGKAKK